MWLKTYNRLQRYKRVLFVLPAAIFFSFPNIYIHTCIYEMWWKSMHIECSHSLFCACIFSLLIDEIAENQEKIRFGSTKCVLFDRTNWFNWNINEAISFYAIYFFLLFFSWNWCNQLSCFCGRSSGYRKSMISIYLRRKSSGYSGVCQWITSKMSCRSRNLHWIWQNIWIFLKNLWNTVIEHKIT